MLFSVDTVAGSDGSCRRPRTRSGDPFRMDACSRLCQSFHWRLVVWFAATSLFRIATTIAAIRLLIRDFLTGVLSQPSGLAGRLTTTLGPAPALWVVVGLLLGVLTASALSSYGSQLRYASAHPALRAGAHAEA